jgi:hypothetical protein
MLSLTSGVQALGPRCRQPFVAPVCATVPRTSTLNPGGWRRSDPEGCDLRLREIEADLSRRRGNFHGSSRLSDRGD